MAKRRRSISRARDWRARSRVRVGLGDLRGLLEGVEVVVDEEEARRSDLVRRMRRGGVLPEGRRERSERRRCRCLQSDSLSDE